MLTIASASTYFKKKSSQLSCEVGSTVFLFTDEERATKRWSNMPPIKQLVRELKFSESKKQEILYGTASYMVGF